MGWLRKKYEQAKTEIKGELRHRAKVKSIQRTSYRQKQYKEAARFGLKKADYETEQKIKAMRQPKPGYNFGGFAGPTTKKPTPSLGVAEYLSSGAPRGRNTSTSGLGDMLGGKAPKRKGKNVRQSLRGMGL